MINGKNIYKKYGKVEVLKGVDLQVDKGEVVSIVGPSGSGKSTLLHILGTLDRADQGSVHMHDTEISALGGKKLAAFRNKHIGFVFQFHHLLPEFSALENVCIPGWLGGRKRSEVREKAGELLEMLGLSHRVDNKPNQLSGGELQRTTGNLDSGNARDLHQLFFDLRNKFNQTFLIVTHNEELAQLSDRVLHMKDGRIV